MWGVILILILLLVVLGILVYKHTDKSKDDKIPVPSNKTLTIQPDIYGVGKYIDHFVDVDYCGVSDNIYAAGPIWRSTPKFDCGEWWLSGNLLSCMVNYIKITGKTSNNIERVLDDIFKTDILLQQMLKGDTAWHDDTMWWMHSFLTLYDWKPERFPTALKWASIIFEDLMKNGYTSFTCEGETFYSTWWVYDHGDLEGNHRYRNTITNSLIMGFALRMYDISVADPSTQQTYGLRTPDQYWFVVENAIKFLMPIKDRVVGLMHDGWNKIENRQCSTPDPTGEYWTYNQGVVLDDFSRAAILYHQKGQYIERDELVMFVISLIKTMTQPAPNNPLVVKVESGAYILQDAHPEDGSNRAFKGIFCRYLSYSVWNLLHLPLYSEEVDILKKAGEFIRGNVDWVRANGERNGFFSYTWNLTKDQVVGVPDDDFTIASSFGVMDLFLSDYYFRSMAQYF